MKTRIFSLILIFFMAFGYIGCSSDSGGSTASSVTTGITGVVSDMEGVALEDVTIYAQGTTVQTQSDGSFTIPASASTAITLTAELDDYARNSKIVVVTDGSLSTQNIKLSKVDTIESFNVANGATIKAKEATIQLPVGTYTLDDGTAYSGEVIAKATYNRVTTVNGSEAFPGDFVGETIAGDEKVLQSYGFIDVTLQSDSGAKIQLASGSTATLTYPMDPNIAETPATIPLWYFDTEKGTWVEDGVATYDAATNTYVGAVTHFSTWNLDAASDGASIKGCIVDTKGDPVPSAQLFLSTEGWNNYADHTITNDDATGEFELSNAPANSLITIIARDGDLSSAEYNVTLPPNTVTTLDSCLVIDQNASELFSSLKGTVIDGDNNPIPNAYVYLSSLNKDIEDTTDSFGHIVDNHSLGSAQTDDKGEFLISVKQSLIENILIKAYYQNLQFNKSFIIEDTTKSTIDLGTIVLATTTLNACVTLEKGSLTDGNITTLADGTVLTDGTTISSNGFTQFGIDKREIAQDTPYNVSSYKPLEFDDNGLFSIIVQKDSKLHTIYTHTYVNVDESVYPIEKAYQLTGVLTITANKKVLNLQESDKCIQLHAITTASVKASTSINSTNTNVHLRGNFVQNDNSWGESFISDELSKSVSFDINKNGVYIITQEPNDWNDQVVFNGTMSVTVDGKTNTITLPDNPQNGEWWTAFKVESYDGNINIEDVNSAW